MLFSLQTLYILLPLVSAAALKPRVLSANDVIIYSKSGRIEIISKEAYFNQTTLPPRPNTPAIISSDVTNTTSANTVSKRCKSRQVVYENPTSYFLNWDVPMSSVVKSPDESSATIAVTAGYSISNTLSVSVGVELDLVKDFLGLSYSIDYSQSWTSEYSAAYTFEIPPGEYGAVVSNPTTTRHSGRVFNGCLGEAGSITEYSGDSYESRAYSGLSWVDGVIVLCSSKSFPLMRCIGEGRL